MNPTTYRSTAENVLLIARDLERAGYNRMPTEDAVRLPGQFFVAIPAKTPGSPFAPELATLRYFLRPGETLAKLQAGRLPSSDGWT